MTNLYTFAGNARKFFFFFALFLLLYIIVDTIGSSTSIQNEVDTAEDVRYFMTVDRLFGEVSKPNIQAINYIGKPIFQIQNKHVASQYPDVSYIYKLAKPKGELGKIEVVRSLVTNTLGFSLETEKVSGNDFFSWSKDNETKTINFDRATNTWKYSTKFFSNEKALETKTLSEINRYSGTVGSFISSMKFNKVGLENPKVTANYLKLNINGDFEIVTRKSDADFVYLNANRVLDLADLKPAGQRPDLKEGQVLPKEVSGTVYYSDPRVGQISMIASNSLSNLRDDIFTFDNREVNFSLDSLGNIEKSSYKIITPDEAWNNLAQGGGSLVSIIPENYNLIDSYIENLEITNFLADAERTELAFWQEKEYNNGYISPIFVFRGVANLADGRIASFIYFIDALKRI